MRRGAGCVCVCTWLWLESICRLSHCSLSCAPASFVGLVHPGEMLHSHVCFALWLPKSSTRVLSTNTLHWSSFRDRSVLLKVGKKKIDATSRTGKQGPGKAGKMAYVDRNEKIVRKDRGRKVARGGGGLTLHPAVKVLTTRPGGDGAIIPQ